MDVWAVFSYDNDITGGAGVVPDTVTLLFPVLITLSSAVNPVIYAIYSSKFRNRMKNLLHCRFVDKGGVAEDTEAD
jgi:hypothetical protein